MIHSQGGGIRGPQWALRSWKWRLAQSVAGRTLPGIGGLERRKPGIQGAQEPRHTLADMACPSRVWPEMRGIGSQSPTGLSLTLPPWVLPLDTDLLSPATATSLRSTPPRLCIPAPTLAMAGGGHHCDPFLWDLEIQGCRLWTPGPPRPTFSLLSGPGVAPLQDLSLGTALGRGVAGSPHPSAIRPPGVLRGMP